VYQKDAVFCLGLLESAKLSWLIGVRRKKKWRRSRTRPNTRAGDDREKTKTPGKTRKRTQTASRQLHILPGGARKKIAIHPGKRDIGRDSGRRPQEESTGKARRAKQNVSQKENSTSRTRNTETTYPHKKVLLARQTGNQPGTPDLQEHAESGQGLINRLAKKDFVDTKCQKGHEPSAKKAFGTGV